MVRWQRFHRRGFPLFLGRRGAEPGNPQGRPADRIARLWQAASGRGRRPADGALHLGRSEPGFPGKACRCVTRPRLPARRLYEAVPRQISDAGKAGQADEEEQGGRLEQPAHQDVAPAAPGKPRSADARCLAGHHRAASRAVHLRAQSLLPPSRREWPPASLYRSLPAERHIVGNHRRQDGVGR